MLNLFIEKFNKHRFLILIFIGVALPSTLLFNIYAMFYGDWILHVKLWGYQNSYFSIYNIFSDYINSKSDIGIPSPIFYSPILSKVVTFFSYFFGIGFGVRFTIVVLYVLQFFLVYLCLKKINNCFLFNISISLMVNFAIYPLTNLYNRGALPEFYSLILLNCILCLFLLWSWEKNVFKKIIYITCIALFFPIIIGGHPITSFYGIPCLLIILLCFYSSKIIEVRKKDLFHILPITLLSLGIILPIIAVFFHFDDQLYIHTYKKEVLYLKYFDHFMVRFFPIPFDPRHFVAVDPQKVIGGTPYHDVQLNFSLLLICIIIIFQNIFRTSKSLILPMFLIVSLTLFVILGSLWPNGFGLLSHDYFHNLLGAYRFTGICNLSILGLLIFLYNHFNTLILNKNNQLFKKFLIFCLFISFFGVTIKVIRSTGSMILGDPVGELYFGNPSKKPILEFFNNYDFNHWNDYASINRYEPLESSLENVKKLKFVPSSKIFGNVDDLVIKVDKKLWAKTNIIAFPWNRILVNRKKIEDKTLKVYGPRNQLFAIYLDKPGTYKISYEWDPPPWFILTKNIGFTCQILLFLIFILNILFLKFRKIY